MVCEGGIKAGDKLSQQRAYTWWLGSRHQAGARYKWHSMPSLTHFLNVYPTPYYKYNPLCHQAMNSSMDSFTYLVRDTMNQSLPKSPTSHSTGN